MHDLFFPDPEAGMVGDSYHIRRVAKLEKRDREAATYVETVIAMRTNFTGDPPYVGWKGLGLALEEALDERDALRLEVERLRVLLNEDQSARS